MSNIDEINDERVRARQIIEYTGTHLFLTGKAGTGKTTFLRQLKKDAPKRMVVLAPTGIAAINAGGSTIHSFFQLPFAPFIPEESYKKMNFNLQKRKIQLIRSLDLVVIDEISMVRADLLDQIDAVLRQYRNRFLPFGGVQLLMIGDLQQLAPVAKEEDWNLLKNYYDSPYFFSSHALQQTYYATIELQKVYRQNDPVFLDILNSIRSNKADAQVLAHLNQRYIPNFEPHDDEKYIRLVTHNRQAQEINDLELSKIPEKTYVFNAKVEGTFPEYSYPTDEILTVKLGAQVMFVKNDLEKRYYNGTLGEIIEIDQDGCTVRTNESHQEIKLEVDEWQNTRYVLNEETKAIEEKVEGTFKQLPIKLAWAITIHKSQGLTFEHAIIDAHSAFAHGQTYVALSRCKTLEGLVLSTPIPASAIIQDHAVCVFNERMEQQQPTLAAIDIMRQQHCLNLISELFDFSQIGHNLNRTIRLLDEYFYQLYPSTLKKYQDESVNFTDKIFTVAEKFKAQYQRLVSEMKESEISSELQERLQKGATYFHSFIAPLCEIAMSTQLPSDNKEIKKRTTNILEELQKSLNDKRQLLAYVSTSGFHLGEYQKCKALVAADQPITPQGEIDIDATPAKAESSKSKRKEKLIIPSEIQNPKLYEMLYKWRSEKAKTEKVPVYMIIQSKALIGMANIVPDNPRTLGLIPYFGDKSLKKYGEEILEVIHKYKCKGASLSKGESSKVSLSMFNEGKTINEIAKERNMSASTIHNHLMFYVKEGDLSLEDIVPSEKIQIIKSYILNQENPKELTLKSIREALGKEYEYSEIRAVLDDIEL